MTNEEAIKNIVAYMYYAIEDLPEEVGKAFDVAIKALKDKTDERPQGEWILVSRNCWKCPYCQELTNEGKNFCPNCGASMVGGDKE